jgi:hypothetical protein
VVLRLDMAAITRLRGSHPDAEAGLVRALAEDLAERVREGTASLQSDARTAPAFERTLLPGEVFGLVALVDRGPRAEGP